MRLTLMPHPETPCAPLAGIAVEVVRRASGLDLAYEATGAIGDILLPSRAAPKRADDLWRRTCFEAFVREGASAAYCEFNFSPSTQWAAYRFDAYREGMRSAEFAEPGIEVSASADRFDLRARLDVRPLGDTAPWRIGLSAVIEDKDGGKSYWALAHPPGKPDFHHPDCFALEIPAADQT